MSHLLLCLLLIACHVVTGLDLGLSGLVATFTGLDVPDTASLGVAFATEGSALTGMAALTSDFTIVDIVTIGRTTTITSTLPLTAAQTLQQFLAANSGQLRSDVFPVFSTTTQVLVTVIGTPTNNTNSTSYDFTCGGGAKCGGVGQCYNGLCGCVPNPDTGFCESGCASGATLATPYADVCVSSLSTVDELVYQEACSARDPRFVNLYPKRRFCQSRDYSASMDRTVFIGLLGNPRDYGNSTGGLRLFTVASPLTMDELKNSSSSGGIVSTRAYVSNLYDNVAPVTSKVWAEVEFDAELYSENSVQLTRLTFLDAIEGDRRYYFQANSWRPYPNDTLPPGAYAYWNASTHEVDWDCQLQHVYNPTTKACEPGCNNGFFGRGCDVSFASTNASSCVVRGFNSNTTLYVGFTCDTAVCLDGYFLGAFDCTKNLAGSAPYVVQPMHGSSTAATAVDVIIIISIIIAVLFVCATIYTRCVRRKKLVLHPSARQALVKI